METDVFSISTILTAIGDILAKVLTWIPSVFTALIDQPIILFFLCFGLVGVIIRWARKVVHF